MRRGALAGLILLLAPVVSHAGGVPESLPGAPAFGAELRAKLTRALSQRPTDPAPRTRHRLPDGSPRYTNRLLLETSPYLLQHAHNPVNWYPWGDEAFATARKLGRPVLVSIGYSTCHWCHVMEEESFDDPETAELLNAHFVAIKVDREARPDVDSIYMAALTAMGRQGGWPLNVWVTPERRPFFGGTYFPPQDAMGRPGFRTVLETVHRIWSEQPAEVEQRAAALSGAVTRLLGGDPAPGGDTPRAAHLLGQVDAWHARFDPTWGGIRGREKFPATSPPRLLLRLHRRTGDARALEMATLTLEQIAAGGIHDHLGGGFHRYATDPRWLVPHFEKTLYDNALLAIAFLEAWQATGRAEFEQVARRTLDYLAREMSDPAGGFHSATDADSPAPGGGVEEGRFFTWTPEEIEGAVGAEAAPLVLDWYGVTDEGDVDGRSVLHTWRTPAEVAEGHGIPPESVSPRIETSRRLLLEARARRPPPPRDEKVLAAWNGLAIGAFARAGLALDAPAYTRRAVRAAEFLLGTRSEGRLHRVWIGGEAEGPAFLSDHAFLIAGLLDLYEASPEPRWLREALALQRVLDERYAAADGGYYRTAEDSETLLAREKPVWDGALPSGNAVTALNLLRLAALTGDAAHRERAFAIFAAFDGLLAREPTGLAELRIALDFALDTAKEVLLVAPEGGNAQPLLDVLRRTWLPNRVLVSVADGPELERHAALVPLLRYKKARGGEPTAYVCENRVCKLPTSDPEIFSRQLAAVKPLEPPAP